MSPYEQFLMDMDFSQKSELMNCVVTLAKRGRSDWRLLLMVSAAQIVKEEIMATHGDISALYRMYFVSGTDYLQLVQNLCPALLIFLQCIQKENTPRITSDQVLITLEHIYGLRIENFIGPLCFSKHIVLYTITGSKRLGQVLNSSGPFASYYSMHRFVQDVTKDILKYPSVTFGDFIIVIDNAQYVGKWWNVKHPDKQNELSQVVTATILLIPDHYSRIQEQQCLSPCNWLQLVPSNMLQKLSIRGNFYDSVIEACLEVYVNEMIHTLRKVLRCKDGYFEEELKESTSDAQVFLSVPTLNQKGQNVFRDIPLKPETAGKKFSFMPRSNPPRKPSLYHAELMNLNPNGYETLTKILAETQENALKTGRTFAIAVMDGLPYTLSSRLLWNTYKCPKCKAMMRTKCNFEAHILDAHGGDSKACGKTAGDHRAFKDVFLLPGPGHIEINTTKCLSKMLFPLMGECLGEVFGFKTQRAKHFVRLGTNFRKSHRMLQVMEEGCWKEMLTVYMNDRNDWEKCSYTGCQLCIRRFYVCNDNDFLQWTESLQSPTLYSISKILRMFLTPFVIYRSAMRCNASDLMHAARWRFGVLYYGMGMRLYQELDTRDILMRLQAPVEIQNYLQQNEIMSYSGEDGRAEGSDFILENQIRTLLRLLPLGMPTVEHFHTAWRLYPILQGFREIVLSDILDKEKPAEKNFRNLVNVWRQSIRDSQYFLRSKGKSSKVIGMKGNELPDTFVSLHESCDYNRHEYWEQFLHTDPDKWKAPQVSTIFISEEDRMKFHLKTRSLQSLFSESVNICKKLRSKTDPLYTDEMIKIVGECKASKDKEALYYLLRELKDKWDEVCETSEDESEISSDHGAFDM